MQTYRRTVFVVALLSFMAAANAVDGPDMSARTEIKTAITAMGGEDLLKSVHAIQYSAVGHRNMLEQSLRPDGPWWQDYFQGTLTRDFEEQRLRLSNSDRGYSSNQWWLQHESWDGGTDIVYSGDAVALVSGGKFSRVSNYYLQYARDQLAMDPVQLLLGAAASTDLHTEPDRQFHGFIHHVVAWTWQGVTVHLLLNGYTGLPEKVEWTRAYPYDTFWNVWGDVKTELVFGMWALEPDGLRYPRQWSQTRNGAEDTDVSITSLTVNPPLDDLRLSIPDQVLKDALAHQRMVDDAPLGYSGSGAPAELVPGVLHVPAAWNVNFIRQDDGIVILEGPVSNGYSQKVMDEAARRYPGLPIKAVITTSDSWPHIGGLREYAARGVPIYAPDLNREVLERLFAAPHTLRPDALQQHPRKPVVKYVAQRTTLGQGANRVELIPYRSETGERQMLVYFPEHKLLYTSDLFAPDSGTTWFTPEYLLELKQTVEREHLDVQRVFGMHYDLTTMNTLDKALKDYLGG